MSWPPPAQGEAVSPGVELLSRPGRFSRSRGLRVIEHGQGTLTQVPPGHRSASNSAPMAQEWNCFLERSPPRPRRVWKGFCAFARRCRVQGGSIIACGEGGLISMPTSWKPCLVEAQGPVEQRSWLEPLLFVQRTAETREALVGGSGYAPQRRRLSAKPM
ncbi:hypothetical protein NDU88_007198 [Pleurodeles waltl]|uniref:Uncharacterized protein n=1 Tax=Pleurodeles waltl TaxID=8319 RepID=A0AAV7SS68_PLEWA|nr:hypothetical protein NDU88_007198 [Pleurodeles waltl]